MNRSTYVLLVALLLIVTTHKLPAPVSEIETPAPAHERQAKAKKASSKPKSAESEAKAKSIQKPSATPVRPKFAGVWTGTIESKNPLVGVGLHPATFVVNGAENYVKETGPVGTFTHPASVNGNILTFTTGVFREITVTMTLMGNGRTGQVNVNDRIWGTCSGTMKKQD